MDSWTEFFGEPKPVKYVLRMPMKDSYWFYVGSGKWSRCLANAKRFNTQKDAYVECLIYVDGRKKEGVTVHKNNIKVVAYTVSKLERKAQEFQERMLENAWA